MVPDRKKSDSGAERAPSTGVSGVSRRTFLERLFTATVVGAVAPSALRALVPQVTVAEGRISGLYTLDLSSIPDLAEIGGSIRFTIPEVGPTFRVIVTRASEDHFEAVNARCPHQGYRVKAAAPGETFLECEAHKSHFAWDGTFISGPAFGRNLTRYETSFDGDSTLQIEIDELASVGSAEVEGTSVSLHSTGPAPGALTFRVLLAHRSAIRLTIWSLDGREMARPFDGRLDAGEGYIHADLSDLPSGLYLYRVEGDSGVLGSGKVVI